MAGIGDKPHKVAEPKGPFTNPDGTPATIASTAIQTAATVALTGLPQTSDKKFLAAIDEVTGAVSKQAIPSSAAIGSSIENKLLVQGGNAGRSVAAIAFEPWAATGLTPTYALAGDTGNANTVLTPLSEHGGVWVNGDFIGAVTKGVDVWLELKLGDKFYMTGGMTGSTMVSSGAWAPIYHTGFGGKEFSIYVFRNATAASPARLGVVVGDQEAEIILQDWNGDIKYQETHAALEVVNIDMDNGGGTSTQREWRMTTSADVTVGKMHNSSDPIDVSIVFPAMAEPMIGYGRFGFATSYDAAPGDIEIFVRDGVTGSGTVAYGAPFSVNSFGAEARLGPNGAMIAYPENRIALYSGADADGGELVPFTPLNWLPNEFGIPKVGAIQRMSFASQFEGDLHFFDDTGVLIYTQNMTRNGPADQRHPAAVSILSNNAVFGGVQPAYVVADIPIDLKVNLAQPNTFTADAATTNDTEETIMHGITSPGFTKPRYNPVLGEWQVYNTATQSWQRG